MKKVISLFCLFFAFQSQAWYSAIRFTWSGTGSAYLTFIDRDGSQGGAIGEGYASTRSFNVATYTTWTCSWSGGSVSGSNESTDSGICDVSIGGAPPPPPPWKIKIRGKNNTPYPKKYTATAPGMDPVTWTAAPGSPWEFNYSGPEKIPISISSPDYGPDGSPMPGYDNQTPTTSPGWKNDGSNPGVDAPADNGNAPEDDNSQTHPKIGFTDTEGLALESTQKTAAESAYNVTQQGFNANLNVLAQINSKLGSLVSGESATSGKLDSLVNSASLISQSASTANGKLDTIAANTSATKSSVDGLGGSLSTIATKNTSMDLTLGDIRTGMTGISGNVADVKTAINGAKTTLDNFKADQHGDMTTLNNAVAGMILGDDARKGLLISIDAQAREGNTTLVQIREKANLLSDINTEVRGANTALTAMKPKLDTICSDIAKIEPHVSNISDQIDKIQPDVNSLKTNADAFAISWSKYSDITTNYLKSIAEFNSNSVPELASKMGLAADYASSMSDAVNTSKRIGVFSPSTVTSPGTSWMQTSIAGIPIDFDFMKMPYMEECATFSRVVSMYIVGMWLLMLLYAHVGEELTRVSLAPACSASSGVPGLNAVWSKAISIFVCGLLLLLPGVLMGALSQTILDAFGVNPLNGYSGPVGYGIYLLDHWLAVAWSIGAYAGYFVSRHTLWAAGMARVMYMKFAS